MVLMENDLADRMKLRVCKMITEYKGLHFLSVLTGHESRVEWLLGKVIYQSVLKK